MLVSPLTVSEFRQVNEVEAHVICLKYNQPITINTWTITASVFRADAVSDLIPSEKTLMLPFVPPLL